MRAGGYSAAEVMDLARIAADFIVRVEEIRVDALGVFREPAIEKAVDLAFAVHDRVLTVIENDLGT